MSANQPNKDRTTLKNRELSPLSDGFDSSVVMLNQEDQALNSDETNRNHKRRKLSKDEDQDANDSDSTNGGMSETLQEIENLLQDDEVGYIDTQTDSTSFTENRDARSCTTPLATPAPTALPSRGLVAIDMVNDSEVETSEGETDSSQNELAVEFPATPDRESALSPGSNSNRSTPSRRRTVSFSNDVDIVDPSRTVVHFTENPAEIIPEPEVDPFALAIESEDEDEIPRPRTPTLVHFQEVPTVIPDTPISEVVNLEDENDIEEEEGEVLVISSEEEEDTDDDDLEEALQTGLGKRMSIKDQLANNKPTNISKLASAQCSICLEPPTVAVFLTCGHIFCSQCAFKALSTTKQSTKEKGPCPLCRHETSYKKITMSIFKKKKKFL
ncbi:hypothetical protein WICPIJ_006004 [Wickerhamomyces pijperi]|uniref:RING-type domain-containing protein n=1 Tax=Wickerhamomyces pijperi TaxID=599730 RepID=A0A9P8Q4V2_WICPI|nr:hypothetical protein WICPIJ_006004 [Wickerhamomyces pijperi]